jgi:large subunit ribosomal protein L34e
MVQRLMFRRRKSYSTASNKTKVVRTPGGRLVMQFLGKKGTVPVCGDTGVKLSGIPALRPYEYKSLAKRKRTVSRAYGGTLCASAVRQRILRAFLVEEQKIVKAVQKERDVQEAAEAAKAKVAAKAKPVAKKAAKPAAKKAAAGKAAVKK